MRLNIGISCYPTFGGSGVVATELGKELARKGHQVHFITYDVPSRLDRYTANIFYHNVEVPPYPLFTYPPYSLALANKIADVARHAHLDIIHAHYAVPHATSAFLAKTMISPWCLRIVTTLHGTDITLVGKDPSYLPVTRFSIEHSDGVTAVSRWLRCQTIKEFHTKRTIHVIPNFVDTERFQPQPCPKRLECLAPEGEGILMHISNFRKVKRTQDLLEILTYVRLRAKAKLVLIGDGPERPKLEAEARRMHREDDVVFLGNVAAVEDLLPCADVFLMPSESESFGLAALEAMSCGVPVVSSDAGGLTELVVHDENGFAFEVGDTGAMGEAAAEILSDEALAERLGEAARATAVERFPVTKVVQRYIDLYERIMLCCPGN